MRHWTPEDRARQADLIRTQKPWEKSTGPKTERGKRASSRNATTHGMTSAEAKALMQALYATSRFLKKLKKGEL